ncbi:hypothetical protein MC885_004295, partial [Smutsia gigantea]
MWFILPVGLIATPLRLLLCALTGKPHHPVLLILIHDLQKEIEKQFDVKEDIPGKHSYAKYNNWNKMVAWMDKMVQKHPEMVSRIKIGTTVEDNPLYVLKATKTYGKNKIMTKLRDQMNFYVLPVFNVEGYVWSWTQ